MIQSNSVSDNNQEASSQSSQSNSFGSLAKIFSSFSVAGISTMKFVNDYVAFGHDSRRASQNNEAEKLLILIPVGVFALTGFCLLHSYCLARRENKISEEIFENLQKIKLNANKSDITEEIEAIDKVSHQIAKKSIFQKNFHRELISALTNYATHHPELPEGFFKKILSQAYPVESNTSILSRDEEELIRKHLVLAIRNDNFQLEPSLYKGRRDNPLFQLALKIKDPELTTENKEYIFKVPSPQSSDLESGNINISTKDLFLIYSLLKKNNVHIPVNFFKSIINQTDIFNGLLSLVKEGFDPIDQSIDQSIVMNSGVPVVNVYDISQTRPLRANIQQNRDGNASSSHDISAVLTFSNPIHNTDSITSRDIANHDLDARFLGVANLVPSRKSARKIHDEPNKARSVNLTDNPSSVVREIEISTPVSYVARTGEK